MALKKHLLLLLIYNLFDLFDLLENSFFVFYCPQTFEPLAYLSSFLTFSHMDFLQSHKHARKETGFCCLCGF